MITEETRVGYMTTSLLENECLEYLKANPKDLDYQKRYDRLKWYNLEFEIGVKND